jgi:excisionase family DNA binding protein
MNGFILEQLFPTGWRRDSQIFWRFSDATTEAERTITARNQCSSGWPTLPRRSLPMSEKPHYMTVPAVSELLSVGNKKVLDFIASGELPAHNLARRSARRPRWRVSREALEQFLAARRSTPPAPTPTRRTKAVAVNQYY